jgi:ApbE superfamily uncharacterized protein (UPF0280 family)
MTYISRCYRDTFDTKRFKPFTVKHFETDLWIGVDPSSFNPDMVPFCQDAINNYRNQLDQYIQTNPIFRNSLSPIPFDQTAPYIAKEMIVQSQNAQVGPMATVAGAFSQFIGEKIISKFTPKEIIIENGGDIFVLVKEELKISVFAGTSPLSGKIGISIEPDFTPLGVCTSSATVGPSLSLGKSDATMIVCKNTALADGYATFYGNMIKSSDDINLVIEKIKNNPDIISAMVVMGEKFGICGKFKLQIFK